MVLFSFFFFFLFCCCFFVFVFVVCVCVFFFWFFFSGGGGGGGCLMHHSILHHHPHLFASPLSPFNHNPLFCDLLVLRLLGCNQYKTRNCHQKPFFFQQALTASPTAEGDREGGQPVEPPTAPREERRI